MEPFNVRMQRALSKGSEKGTLSFIGADCSPVIVVKYYRAPNDHISVKIHVGSQAQNNGDSRNLCLWDPDYVRVISFFTMLIHPETGYLNPGALSIMSNTYFRA